MSAASFRTASSSSGSAVGKFIDDIVRAIVVHDAGEVGGVFAENESDERGVRIGDGVQIGERADESERGIFSARVL